MSSLDPLQDSAYWSGIVQDAVITRYLTAVGFIILCYDHALTFPSELSLVWSARRSFAKYAFLGNRYLVLVCLVTVVWEMSPFSATHLTDVGCKTFLLIMSMLAVCSVGMANLLVLMRVLALWDDSKLASRFMILGFVFSFLAMFVTFLLASIALLPGITYSPVLKMCATTTSTPLLIATWGCPIIFDILSLLLTLSNTLSRPRNARIPFRQALASDGASSFLVLTAFRTLNLSLATSLNPGRTMLGVFLVWACVTALLNRSLLRLRLAELRDSDSDSDLGLGGEDVCSAAESQYSGCNYKVADRDSVGLELVVSGRASAHSDDHVQPSRSRTYSDVDMLELDMQEMEASTSTSHAQLGW